MITRELGLIVRLGKINFVNPSSCSVGFTIYSIFTKPMIQDLNYLNADFISALSSITIFTVRETETIAVTKKANWLKADFRRSILLS